MQWKQYLYQKPLQVAFIFLALLTVKELVYINTFKSVSPIADGYSESNSIRGGTFFYEKGITSHYGLPDLCYSEQHDGKGFKGKNKTECADGVEVYTHYPPGPEYMAWLGMQVCGTRNDVCLRILPITISVAASVFLIKTLFLIFPAISAMWLSLAAMAVPMYSNYFHGLHHQSYNFAILLIQVSLAIRTFTQVGWNKWWIYPVYFLIGFYMGFMSFDFAFLATFFSVPFFFILKDEYNLKWRTLLGIVFFSGLGFTIAHILHFYQVVLFYGSFDKAFDDLFGAAKYRYNYNGGTLIREAKVANLNPLSLLKDFLWRAAGNGKNLSINLINFVWIIVFLRFVKAISFKKSTFQFNVTNKDLLGVLASIIVAGLWTLVMRQHAFIHGFIARHYYLVYFVCLMILLRRSKKESHDKI